MSEKLLENSQKDKNPLTLRTIVKKKNLESFEKKSSLICTLFQTFFIKESTKKEDFLASLDFSFMFFFLSKIFEESLKRHLE